MLHEILMRLWHNSGSSELSSLYELQEFLHPGEKSLLEAITEIAANYHWITAFCRKVQSLTTSESTNNQPTEPSLIESSIILPGRYVKAFASGINEVLGDYRNEVIKLEELFLHNPQLPLTFVFSSLEKYEVLFNVLKSVIQVLQKDNLHGCLLMGRLHKYIYSGVHPIASAAERITHHINNVFYLHLCNWIIYGILMDPHNEFFICDGKCADPDFLYPEQMDESLTSSGLVVDLHKKSKIRKPPPVRKFYINWNMVPIFINEDTAESILFMGRIVWIINNDPKKATDDQCHTKNERDIWEGKDIDYYKRVQALENQSFDQDEFQRAIEECRIKLTKYLWSVMLDEGNLKEHLQLIRDYYALGRGELFHQFIAVAESHVKNAALDQSGHYLNYIFMETARKIYGENDKSYLRFEITVSKSDELNVNLWSKLQLNFEISWPLHIVFHPKSMDLYNKLFLYLLRLSKTQIHLNKLWHSHMAGKQQIDRRVWTLRQHLLFLVNNLQYYLQVDVIEAQFSVLLKAVENANEFEDIIKVHHEFITNILAKTFVLIPDEAHIYQNKHHLHQTPAVKCDVPSKVYNVITRLLELCDNFCVIAASWNPILTEPEVLEFEEFQKRTDTIVESLLFILYRLHEKAKGQHLLQLIYQLDFNGYFSKNKTDFNLTCGP